MAAKDRQYNTVDAARTGAFPSGREVEFEDTLERLCADQLAAIQAFEDSQRRFFPGAVAGMREEFQPMTARLDESRSLVERLIAPSGLEELRNGLMEASRLCLESLRLSTASDYLEESLGNYRKASRRVCRALETLYPLHRLVPSVNRFFLEEPLRDGAEEYLREAQDSTSAGLQHIGMERAPYARGSLSLYVPESCDGSRPRPLVVALHGGFGHGRDFIWTWLREARSRRFVLAAPSSRGGTWSITGPDVDAEFLQNVLRHIRERWNVDEKKILLTGLSDGATYLLKRALDETSPFSAFAPLAGILPPFDLRHVRGRRIFWVHGARDWMFPLWYAKTGCRMLTEAGADIRQEIVPDLYHAYPREYNDRILQWFDPSLALPGGSTKT